MRGQAVRVSGEDGWPACGLCAQDGGKRDPRSDTLDRRRRYRCDERGGWHCGEDGRGACREYASRVMRSSRALRSAASAVVGVTGMCCVRRQLGGAVRQCTGAWTETEVHARRAGERHEPRGDHEPQHQRRQQQPTQPLLSGTLVSRFPDHWMSLPGGPGFAIGSSTPGRSVVMVAQRPGQRGAGPADALTG